MPGFLGLGLGIGLNRAALGGGGGGGPAPTPVFETIVIEGDSVTSNDPQQTDANDGFYSYAWKVANPGVTSFVMANGSRTVGGAAYNSDLADLPGDQNTLFQQVDEDLALDPDLITAKIGVNDIGSTGVSVATYIQRLKDYAALIRAGGAKLAYGCPTPTAVGSSYNQGQVDAYMAKWNTLFTTHNIRNPANWSQWADYYIPLGEHPDFRDGTVWTIDGVHPTSPVSTAASGQAKLFATYSAAMATLLDTARVTAAGPYQSVWDAFGPFTDLAVGVPITRRVIVSGLAWAGHANGVSVTGGDATVKTNGKVAPGYSYNGDVIDFTLTPSAAHETDTAVQLTIGGETRTLTYRTAANVTPADYVHGDVVGLADGVTSRSMPGLTFSTGKAVLIIKAHENNQSTTVTLTSTVGGSSAQAMTLRAREPQGSVGALETWELPVTAGTYNFNVSYGGFIANPVVSYGTITGGVFVSAASLSTDNASDPHETPNATVPANGIALAAFLEYAAAGAAGATITSNGATIVDSGRSSFNGEQSGITLAERATSGVVGFNLAFGSFPRTILVYQAG